MLNKFQLLVVVVVVVVVAAAAVVVDLERKRAKILVLNIKYQCCKQHAKIFSYPEVDKQKKLRTEHRI